MDYGNNIITNQSAKVKIPDLVTASVRNLWDGIRQNLDIKSLPGEIWINCIGGFGMIQVSSFMRVKHLPKNIILSQKINGDGYWQIRFTHNKRRICKRVHRLYGEQFMRNPFKKPYINHKNLITTDNIPLNLEWCTPLENTLHAKINMAIPTGVKVKHSKLTEDKVLEIYTSNESYRIIAIKYDIAKRMVAKIKNGINWASVTKHTKDGLNKYNKANFN